VLVCAVQELLTALSKRETVLLPLMFEAVTFPREPRFCVPAVLLITVLATVGLVKVAVD
jgi:hypothetical protein